MHIVIAITYGLTIWMSGVIYTVIAIPKWSGIAIALAPVVVTGSVIGILTLDWIIAIMTKGIMAIVRAVYRTEKRS